MMKIIPRSSATLAFGWLVLIIGVNSVDISVVDSLPESIVVTTPHPKTTFIMDLRITNRIYNDSLNDQESEEYKSLRQEVEQLFYDVYAPTSLAYLGTNQMTFSNGSVIASAQLLFGTTVINPALGRSFFLSTYKQLPSPTLEIDPDYLASGNSVDIFAEKFSIENTVAPKTTVPNSKSRFLIDIKITNRIYNSTLNDEESAYYISLRKEVDKLFFDVYDLPPLAYIAMDEITFRNGSVIASAELLFGTTMLNPILLRSLFVQQYEQLQSPQLAIDLNFVSNDQLPTQQPVIDVTTTPPSTTLRTSTASRTTTSTPNPPASTRHITTHATFPTSHSTSAHSPTHTSHSSTSLSPTSTPLNTIMHPSTNATQSPKNTTFIITVTPNTTEAPNTTNTTAASNTTNTTIAHHPTNTTVAHHPTNTTVAHHPTNTTVAHHPTNTTVAHHPTNTTVAHHPTNTTVAHHPTNTTVAHHPSNTTLAPHTSNSVAQNITNRVLTISPNSPTTAGLLVPGWGIALLVLVAVCFLLLIIILIILLVMCCCWPSKRTVVKDPEVIIPPMYFNPDIPMYSTHSTVDSPNGKQVDVRDRPPKNRTGMYVVNK